MRVLDLFCGAGGAAAGYARAGFEVIGVDIAPQPRFPFDFVQADAMTYPLDGFDLIHASPPCQAFTSMKHMGKGAGVGAVDLIAAMRFRLALSGIPYVIENVPGAPLRNPVRLCGTSFGLGTDRDSEWQPLWRHRLFESDLSIRGRYCQHPHGPGFGRALAVYGDHPRRSLRDVTRRVNRARSLTEAQQAMDIDWMTWKEITQAIPPAYTEYIGNQVRQTLEVAA